ncbi:MAG: radical SAM protein [Candidatus Gracilibacteria bacterium]
MNSLKNRSKEYLGTRPKVALMVNDKQACNLRCTCCYLSYEGVRDPDEVFRIVENLRSEYRVVIVGSEILTDLGYLKSLQLAGQKYVLTNGILLARNPNLYDTLKEYGIEEIQVSLNFREQKEKSGITEVLLPKVIQEAKERGFFVRVTCMISAETYENVEEMCDIVKSMGADAVHFTRYIKSGGARGEDTMVVNQEQKKRFFQLVDEARKKYPKEELEIRVNGNFGPKKGSKGEELSEQNRYCPAGKNAFVVAPDNTVYGCPYLMDASPIGELIEESRLKITNDLCNGNRCQCLTDLLC